MKTWRAAAGRAASYGARRPGKSQARRLRSMFGGSPEGFGFRNRRKTVGGLEMRYRSSRRAGRYSLGV